MLPKTKIGVLGAGAISKAYLKHFKEQLHFAVDVVAVADIVESLAATRAKEAGFSEAIACAPDALYANRDVSIIVNLTPIWTHLETNTKILEAGKHCYSEKPLAQNRGDAAKLLALAAKKGLRVGCAPDTWLGGGHQLARKLIDDGVIGKPTCANAAIWMDVNSQISLSKKIGGMHWDLGPYYAATLVNLLGPAKRVVGFSSIPIRERMAEAAYQANFGERIVPDIPTMVSGIIEFENGVLANFTTTSEAHQYLPRLEVIGRQGMVDCGDPNSFETKPKLQMKWNAPVEMPITHDYTDNARGLGVADMAYAILQNRDHRASGELALHVVDILQGLAESNGRAIEMSTTCRRPAALRPGRGICAIMDV